MELKTTANRQMRPTVHGMKDCSWRAGPRGLEIFCSLKPMDLLSITNTAKRQGTP